jgi:hypothetical protein
VIVLVLALAGLDILTKLEIGEGRPVEVEAIDDVGAIEDA